MREIARSDLQFAAANGIKIAYDTFGKSQDVPILLIMGLGSQMILWDEDFCRQLASKGYLVIRFDNRDMGLSTKFNRMSIPDPTTVTDAMTRGDIPCHPECRATMEYHHGSLHRFQTQPL